MAWSGYFVYGGNEFINLPRTEAYANGTTWFRPTQQGTDLPLMTGEGQYVSPIIDNAPWTDPDDPASYDFYGFYPLDVNGIEDSTATSTVAEFTGDGGVPGRVRRGTKAVVFNGLLLAASDCGADYGMKWLRSVLNGTPCGNVSTQTCNGDDLCYLSCEPTLDTLTNEVEVLALNFLDGGNAEDFGEPGEGGPNTTDPNANAANSSGETFDGCDAELDCDGFVVVATTGEDCLDEMSRSLRKVVFNSGPTVTLKHDLSDGGAMWMVTFTGVAGVPYEFGVEKPIVQGFGDSSVTNPYVIGVEGVVDLEGVVVDESGCATEVFTPVFDPLCPALVVPPTLPMVPMGCYVPPANWHRRQFTIPNTLIPLYTDAVPMMRVYARDSDVRNLRLRFYSDVNGDGSIVDDPCAWCGDIVFSYIPQDMTLVFDGSEQVVYMQSPGGVRRRADNLVFATDGGPFEWPALSCGFTYVVTVDLPQTQPSPVIDFSIYNRVA